MNRSPHTLITGADGYIGTKLASALLQDPRASLLLWVRSSNAEEFKQKGQHLCETLCNLPGRVRFAHGDLRDVNPFSEIEAETIETIVHTAAVTRFNVDRQTATSVNIEGTEKLIRFAKRCRRLSKFLFISTVYASGLRAGEIREEAWEEPAEGFSNYYEWSKFKAEQLFLKEAEDLPWQIARVATVIADDESGTVTQQNAFHNTLKLLYYGLMSLIPGKPETPLYFVTGDWVTRCIDTLARSASSQRFFHVCHSMKDAIDLQSLLDVVFEQFDSSEDFRRRRVLRPLYSDPASFELLREAVTKFSGDVVNQAVSSVSPFAGQLYINKDVRNDHMVSELHDDHAPDAKSLIRKTCDYLVATKWGRVNNAKVT